MIGLLNFFGYFQHAVDLLLQAINLSTVFSRPLKKHFAAVRSLQNLPLVFAVVSFCNQGASVAGIVRRIGLILHLGDQPRMLGRQLLCPLSIVPKCGRQSRIAKASVDRTKLVCFQAFFGGKTGIDIKRNDDGDRSDDEYKGGYFVFHVCGILRRVTESWPVACIVGKSPPSVNAT